MNFDLKQFDRKLFDLIERRRDLLRRDRRLRLILLATLTLVVLLLILILALALALRPRHAVTTINSVRLSSLAASLSLSPNAAVDLNLTLAVNATIRNPNPVSFRYPAGGSAELYYRNSLAGAASIPPGEISSRGTEAVDVELTVFAGRLAGDVEVYKDLVKGVLDLTAFVRIKGKVKILGVRRPVVTYTTCDVRVSLRNRTVEDTDCRYRTKI